MDVSSYIFFAIFGLLAILVVIFPKQFSLMLKSVYMLKKPPNLIIVRAMGLTFLFIIMLFFNGA